MSLIWATRGRTWGFRFLRNGGYEDPLLVYDEVFSGVGDESEVWCRVAEKGALRFPDPRGRQDRAGRIIPHDFVVLGPLADEIDSVEEGRRLVWPLISQEFDQLWELPKTPSTTR
ncbi:hypothetical protein RCG67_01935 [Kocuria sp. CPCC 205292]|uniref:hypothetical protein n=1 Tax=Kocuria cellulosilytica TaxID=3071451 RepID=UPI0034D655B5